MDLNKKISFSSYVMFQTIDDEAIILDIRTQKHFGLNQIASIFLSHIQNNTTTKDALDLILQEFDVTKQQLETDISALLDTLLEHGLIETT